MTDCAHLPTDSAVVIHLLGAINERSGALLDMNSCLQSGVAVLHHILLSSAMFDTLYGSVLYTCFSESKQRAVLYIDCC